MVNNTKARISEITGLRTTVVTPFALHYQRLSASLVVHVFSPSFPTLYLNPILNTSLTRRNVKM